MTVLKLKKDQERRLLAGHCWVFSNEVDTERSPLKNIEPGDPVEIISQRDRWLGWGYANPHSLICARLVSRQRGQKPAAPLWQERLAQALALREALYGQPYYRLVHGEADGLPGLVVDRYGDVLVGQITTAGMERQRPALEDALQTLLAPNGLLWRNDGATRALEGLASEVMVGFGEVPDEVTVVEDGARFQVATRSGQKTGWFYDQAPNRDRLARFAPDRRVLDVFSYVGGWGVRAARAGARQVLCVDSSADALVRAQAHAEANGVGDRMTFLNADAFAALRSLREQDEQFDVVVLDPPAFIKRRKDIKTGTQAYQRLAEAALRLVVDGGMLVTASCSFHLSEEALLRLTQRAAVKTGRGLQLLERGSQGPDHPVHPAIPETAYLKALFCRVVPGF